MESTGMEKLAPTIVVIELWALTLARVMGVFVQAPIFGSRHISMKIRVGAAIVLATGLFPGLPMPQDFYYSFPQHAVIIFQNIMVGLVIGWVSYLTMTTVQFAGELCDVQLGLSIAASFDPSAGGTVNLLRRFHFYVAMMVYLIIDGHHSLITAIYRSFEAVPVDNMVLIRGALVYDIVWLTSDLLYLGVQIASPVLAALFIVQMALGLVARASPQMNVFMVSFPVNIGVGTAVLALTLPYLTRKLIVIFDDNYRIVLKYIILMSPGG